MGDLLTLEAFIATGTQGTDGKMHWLPSDAARIERSLLESLEKFINTFSDDNPFLVKADVNKAITMIRANRLAWYDNKETDSLGIAIGLYLAAVANAQAVGDSNRFVEQSSRAANWKNKKGHGRFIPPEWGGDDPLIQERPNNALSNAEENKNIGHEANQHVNNKNEKNDPLNTVGVNATIVNEWRQRRNRDRPAPPKRSRTGNRGGGKHTRTRKHRSKRHTKRNRK